MNFKHSKQLPSLIVVTLLVLSVTSCMNPVGLVRQAMTLRFETVQGRVSKINPAVDDQPAEIHCTYAIEGRRYTCECFAKVDLFETSPEELAATVKVRDAIDVHYNPNDRSDAVLVKGLAWVETTPLFAVAAGILSISYAWCCVVYGDPSKLTHREALERRAVREGSRHRIRMMPINIGPVTAGVLCFVTCSLLVLLILHVVINRHYVFNGAAEVVPFWMLVVASVVLGGYAGLYDYCYTKKGLAEGRWDLVVDRDKKLLAMPATGLYDEPASASFEDVRSIRVEVVRIDDESWHRETLGVIVDFADGREKREKCIAEFSQREKAEALADWIQEKLSPQPTQVPPVVRSV